jgi:hypothetical protein
MTLMGASTAILARKKGDRWPDEAQINRGLQMK